MQSNEIIIHLNGKPVVVRDPKPGQTLIQFIREDAGLTGTKLVCGEGACGACTVMLSRFEPLKGRVVNRAVNACLFPLCAADGCAVTTVEGLGSSGRLHDVQSRISKMHGSQCGFCTPGFVMTFYSFLSENPRATGEEVEKSIDGNLCRCTGYRPILDAARSLGCDCKGGCKKRQAEIESCVPFSVGPLTDPKTIQAAAVGRQAPLAVVGEKCSWYAPRTIEEMVALKGRFPQARIIVGNTEVGVDMRLKLLRPTHFIHAVHVPELNKISVVDGVGIEVGAAVSLTDLDDFLRDTMRTTAPERCRVFAAVRKMLAVFACRQIRNVACIGGNLTTASPTSDLNPIFLAADAKIAVRSATGSRIASPRDWFVGYRKVALAPEEVVVSVTLPFTRPNEYVEVFKVSRRKEDDIQISGACFRVVLEKSATPVQAKAAASEPAHRWHNPLLPEDGSKVAPPPTRTPFVPPQFKPIPVAAESSWVVSDFSVAFGSMAIKTSLSNSAAAFLKGKPWTSEVMPGVFDATEKDLPLQPMTPGGVVDFRRCMTRSLFFKFFLRVCAAAYGPGSVPPEYASALEDEIERPVTKSSQSIEERKISDESAVGAPLPHISAEKHATGEAIFTDDLPYARRELFGAIVGSAKAHARIKRVDATKALAVKGVAGVFTAKDIPAKNFIGEVAPGEELFASEIAPCVGFPIGIVAAETKELAREAAALVDIEYEELQPILTLKEAVDAGSFLSGVFEIHRGNVEDALKTAELVIEGETVTEGQDHFYLEPMSSIATPGEAGEMHVVSSTQNPHMTQMNVAGVLGVPGNMVVVSVRRVGGGFGGKETRSVPFACAAAVAAARLHRPVRLVLDRDVDMPIHGTRHPFMARYRAGFTKEGKVVAYDIELFSNGGYSLDLSVPVLHRALFHVDNAYFIPNLRCRGRVYKTNRPTNTAFRGFGGPQAMMVIETVIERIASVIGAEPAAVRLANMFTEGQKTHYQKAVVNCNLQRVWEELMQTSEYEKRKAEIAEFNSKNRLRKRGIAAVPVKFGLSFTHAPLNQAGALVHVYDDGSVLVSHGAVEIGQGVSTKMAQVAATALRIPIEFVRVCETSTDKVPNTSATAASVQADLNGMAVLDACRQIRTRIDAWAASVGSEAAKMNWKELVHAAHAARIDLSAHGFFTAEYGYDWKTGEGKVFAYFTFGAACSEVEVDVLTGEHTVLRSDVVMDLGQSMNPAIDVGQVEGAFVQGAGWATLEQIVVFRGSGQQYTKGPGTYKIPGPGDVPRDFRVRLLRGSSNPFAIHSSKGVGEPPFFLGTSVFFAIRHAISSARQDSGISGFFQLSLPATVDRIRMLMRDAFTESPGVASGLPGCFIEEFPATEDLLVAM